MRWLLNSPALNNDDRYSAKQENIGTALEVWIRTGAVHNHTETRGVMQREMKYSAGFWWRVLNQSQCCHSNLKTSTGSSSPLPASHTSTPPLLEELGAFSIHTKPFFRSCPHSASGETVKWSIFEGVCLPAPCCSLIQKPCKLCRRWSGKKGIGEGQPSP